MGIQEERPWPDKEPILKEKQSAAGMGILSIFLVHCYEHLEHYRLVSMVG